MKLSAASCCDVASRISDAKRDACFRITKHQLLESVTGMWMYFDFLSTKREIGLECGSCHDA